jgi:hypothetical protein
LSLHLLCLFATMALVFYLPIYPFFLAFPASHFTQNSSYLHFPQFMHFYASHKNQNNFRTPQICTASK